MTTKKNTKPAPVAKDQSDSKSLSTTPTTGDFPIVGIGASAGGLAAFEAFFSGMPVDKDPGMAFVLVQHLSPDHKSLLTDLLRRFTRMAVFEVEDGVVVQANCVYIIPPNRDMAFLNGALQLLDPVVPRGQRFPIDFLFRSLAQDLHERAICIILSGTGSDGTLGLRAIKGEGGMAMAQSLASSEFDGMPSSAIDTGLVDYVLPPAEMPAQLLAYAVHAFDRPRMPATPGSDPQAESLLKKLFILLRARTDHDFSEYKPSTINRRIERRMALHQIGKLEGYIKYLQQTPEEIDALFRDLLIGVTSFFRDPLAFTELEQVIIPRIFANKPTGSDIRIWICGCSTGEEAYSIAMLLHDQLERSAQNFRVQLFASDIDKRAIDQARQGFFPASIANDLTPERLARYFKTDEEGKTYRIQKRIRDMLIFSEQDVLRDPPFSKLDLISCRNLMIYMGPVLQKKMISLFHYALNPGGFLFLGTSETIGDFAGLFATLDRKQKLYQRKEEAYVNPRTGLMPLIPPKVAAEAVSLKPLLKQPLSSNLPLQALAERALLQQVIQAGVLINRQGDILYLHGRTGMYLEPATGGADSYNILKMAREGLQADLSVALHKAALSSEVVQRKGLRVKTNGDFSTVNLRVSPVSAGTVTDPETALFLVVLEQAEIQPGESTSSPTSIIESPDTQARLAALQQALQDKDDYIQSANEEQQSASEELKSANEELQSINEEMQSTNEELETSKEELQSVNEELATINAELQAKVLDLSRVNNDINNLVAGTGIGTIFVDMQLQILRFTPGATQIIKLIAADVGRPIGNFASTLVGYDQLENDLRLVLDTLIPKEVEVQTLVGAYYSMRILPYRTTDNRIEGAVINFVNITDRKQAEQSLKKANDLLRLAVVVHDAHDAIILQDMAGRILAWNPSAQRMYGWTEAEALVRNIRDLVPEDLRESDITRVRQLSQKKIIEPYRTQRIAKDGSVVDIWLTATVLLNEAGKVYAIATTERSWQEGD